MDGCSKINVQMLQKFVQFILGQHGLCPIQSAVSRIKLQQPQPKTKLIYCASLERQKQENKDDRMKLSEFFLTVAYA